MEYESPVRFAPPTDYSSKSTVQLLQYALDVLDTTHSPPDNPVNDSTSSLLTPFFHTSQGAGLSFRGGEARGARRVMIFPSHYSASHARHAARSYPIQVQSANHTLPLVLSAAPRELNEVPPG
jgi:hypothetical protein